MNEKLRPSLETSLLAQEEFHTEGNVKTARCERCDTILVIAQLSESVLRMTCACGLYDDVLRGI